MAEWWGEVGDATAVPERPGSFGCAWRSTGETTHLNLTLPAELRDIKSIRRTRKWLAQFTDGGY